VQGENMQNTFRVISFFILFGILSGCGTGDWDETSNSAGTPSVPTPSTPSPSPSATLSVDCDGSYCGSNANTYTGSGIGAWHYKNNGNKNAALNISLSNVMDKDITIVFTNEGANKVQLPPIYVDAALKNEISTKNAEHINTFNYIPNDIKNFKLLELTRRDDKLDFNLTPLHQTWSENSKYNWNVSTDLSPVSRAATLRKQKQVGTDTTTRTINVWVEDNEYGDGKIDAAKVDEMASYIDTIYTNVVKVAGEPWGSHEYSNLISSDQPLNIVLINLKNDQKPFGIVGYFWARDNYLKTAYPNTSDSNEALVIFVDTETYYIENNAGIDGKFYILSTIAHELTHAVHFYQRFVLIGEDFDTFLNEMTAIMMEDVVAKKIDSTFNNVKLRYVQWHKDTLYGHNFADWITNDDSDDSYDIAGSFGAFLLRQHGIDFYKTLFTTTGDLFASNKSLNILNKAIKKYNGEGLGRALQRWGASIAMLPADNSPKGFGYPERNDINGFYFEEFDGNTYKNYRSLPEKSPNTLEGYAHFPFLRKTINYTYTEQFIVPPNVSVSVIIQ
jgi:hypothetical protein